LGGNNYFKIRKTKREMEGGRILCLSQFKSGFFLEKGVAKSRGGKKRDTGGSR